MKKWSAQNLLMVVLFGNVVSVYAMHQKARVMATMYQANKQHQRDYGFKESVNRFMWGTDGMNKKVDGDSKKKDDTNDSSFFSIALASFFSSNESHSHTHSHGGDDGDGD
jgi:hypothetical protein